MNVTTVRRFESRRDPKEGNPMKPTPIRRTALCLLTALAAAGFSYGDPTASLARSRIVTAGGKSYMLTSKLKNILVGDFTYGYDHHSQLSPQNMISTLNRLATTEGWNVEVTTVGNDVTAAKLATKQVFVANYISWWAQSGKFPSANAAAVQNFVETQGGGVMIMHSSGDSGPSNNWPWFYNTAHPVGYTGESSRKTVSAPVFIPQSAKSHPIMDGISFAGKDTVIWPQGEWHTFQKIITSVYPNADVLLRMDGSKCTKDGLGPNCGNGTGGYNYNIPGGYPATWTFPDKKGSIGYFMEAHDLITMNAMTQPVWDKFFRQFMYYIAGYDSVPVASVLKHGNNDLNFILDPSGVSFHPSDEAGVFINKAGTHVITMFDMTGHKLKEIRGSKSPVDYDLATDMQGAKAGVYVMRVAITGGVVRSKRFFVN